ncbi:MAG: response regulator [Candidatus Aminicenantes bacterium]|nr:response regulator [Candidatus Aminicenantes bacterium]
MTPKKRILVVDDEVDFIKMLQARLRIEGYEVLTAEDGIQAIQIARKEKPDLIILDIMMPGLDGHSVCDMIKKSTLTWSIPVIYLSARTGQADELTALEKGAKYYLTKPYNPAVLTEMIKSALTENEAAAEKRGGVLVIDQDIVFAHDCEVKLKQAGYDVILAPTAAEGLRAARGRFPDAILLDFQTSHDDAHASIKIISHDDALKNIPLFVLAPQAVKDRVDPRTSDPDNFIVKPVLYPLLLDALEKALKLKKKGDSFP